MAICFAVFDYKLFVAQGDGLSCGEKPGFSKQPGFFKAFYILMFTIFLMVTAPKTCRTAATAIIFRPSSSVNSSIT